MQITFCQYKSGIAHGAKRRPKIKISLGMRRYVNSFIEERA
jgi:hypothetical protein